MSKSFQKTDLWLKVLFGAFGKCIFCSPALQDYMESLTELRKDANPTLQTFPSTVR